MPSISTTASDTSSRERLEISRRLVLDHGWNATAYQILNPGFERWIAPRRDAVVGYVTVAGYRVVAGSPICHHLRLADVVEMFEEETHRRRLWSCYFAADERLARLLHTRGPLDRILLGAQPVWDPRRWRSIVDHKASLRAQLRRAMNKGVIVEPWPSAKATGHPELQRCLDEWLRTRGLPPLHFLVEPETLHRLQDRRVFVAQRGGRPLAFLVASPIPRREGWLIEQTVRGSGAPNGTGELLIDTAMRELGKEGAHYVTLGLSPLSRRSGIESRDQPWWIRSVLSATRAYGRRFYDFEGLDAYKAKFLPEHWEPIYAITSERRIGPGTLWAIAGAFGRMSPIRLVLTGLLRSLGRA